MSENKRFVYYEHKGADYILENPNTDLDFIEMLGDCLEPKEIVDKLNELYDESKSIKNRIKKRIEFLKNDLKRDRPVSFNPAFNNPMGNEYIKEKRTELHILEWVLGLWEED